LGLEDLVRLIITQTKNIGLAEEKGMAAKHFLLGTTGAKGAGRGIKSSRYTAGGNLNIVTETGTGRQINAVDRTTKILNERLDSASSDFQKNGLKYSGVVKQTTQDMEKFDKSVNNMHSAIGGIVGKGEAKGAAVGEAIRTGGHTPGARSKTIKGGATGPAPPHNGRRVAKGESQSINKKMQIVSNLLRDSAGLLDDIGGSLAYDTSISAKQPRTRDVSSNA